MFLPLTVIFRLFVGILQNDFFFGKKNGPSRDREKEKWKKDENNCQQFLKGQSSMNPCHRIRHFQSLSYHSFRHIYLSKTRLRMRFQHYCAFWKHQSLTTINMCQCFGSQRYIYNCNSLLLFKY